MPEKRRDTSEETEKKRARGARGSASEPLPDWLPIEPWEAFVEMRVKLRAPLTQKAVKLTIAALSRLRVAGHDPKAVLEQSVMRSWRGLFAVESGGNSAQPRASPPEPYVDPAAEFKRKQAAG